jgi:hypothetical protein
MDDSFGQKLAMVLKALTLSNGRFAADLGVDKSVVGRWLSGAVKPSMHNLARLTAQIAAKSPGFSMLDWDLDLAELQALVTDHRRTPPKREAAMLLDWPPRGVVEEAAAATALRGDAYEGFWRSTRLSNEVPGRFVHDQILMRKSANGLLQVRTGVIEMRFEGISFPSQTQLIGLNVDAESGVFIFSVFNGVLRHRADVMDGLALTVTRNAGGSAVAMAVVMERTGELTGDEAADDARYEASIQMNPLAPEGSVPEHIRNHLFKDVGPTAFAAGGAAILNMAFANSIASGSDPRRTRAA